MGPGRVGCDRDGSRSGWDGIEGIGPPGPDGEYTSHVRPLS